MLDRIKNCLRLTIIIRNKFYDFKLDDSENLDSNLVKEIKDCLDKEKIK